MSTGQVGSPFFELFLRLMIAVLFLSSCQPAEPEMVVVTEVVQLGDEQIIITRLTELEPTATPTVQPTVGPPDPVSLDISYEERLPNLDPQQASNKPSLDLAESLFAGLTNYNHETNLIEPELAQSWLVSGDGRTWSFKLRDDLYWLGPLSQSLGSNQTAVAQIYRPVDAHDVVFAVQRICSSSNAVPDAFLFFIIDGCEAVYQLTEPSSSDLAYLGVEAVDDSTVEFSLVRPASDFLTLTTLPQMRPVPRDLVEEYGDEWRDFAGEIARGWQTPENIVTSGPFVPVSSSIADDGLTMNRNTRWPLPTSGNVDVINSRFQVDEEEMFEQWKARQLDLSILPAGERESFLDSTPEKALLVTNQTVFYIGFNFDSPVFREQSLRRAFSAAIDRNKLIDTMLEGRADALRHFTPQGNFGAPPADEVGVGYSPDFALQQIDQSSIRNCRLLPPVTMLVSTADISLLQAELIRDMWIEELDCDEKLIEIEQVDFGDLLAATSQTNSGSRPDMWELAWPAYYPDAHNYLSDLFHCSDGENRQNRSCSDVDRLLGQARAAPDPNDRIDLYRTIESRFFSETGEFPVIPLFVRGDYVLVQSWLRFSPALSGGEQFDTYIIDPELKRLERSRG